MCEVTIVIPNYNGEKYLVSCLKALYDNTEEDIQVIVVDNGSADQAIVEAKALYPQVRYILLDRNYGFCKAVNIGIRASDTEYVLLLNNDTEIEKGFVESLLRTIKRNQNIFSVEAKMIQYRNRNLLDSAGTYYNALGWAFARGRDTSAERYDTCCRTFAACAGAALYRKKIFDEIGYFDEKHFAYLEDIDVGYRARIYGYINIYEPKAHVVHIGSASTGSRYNEFKVKYSGRNNIYLIYKNMPLVQIVLNLPFLATGFFIKIIFFYRKGLGRSYLEGLKEGFAVCQKSNKVIYDKAHFLNYLKIQMELWVNVILRFL